MKTREFVMDDYLLFPETEKPAPEIGIDDLTITIGYTSYDCALAIDNSTIIIKGTNQDKNKAFTMTKVWLSRTAAQQFIKDIENQLSLNYLNSLGFSILEGNL